MTLERYLQVHTMCTAAEQVILITLFCEILVVLWDDENAKIGAFLGESLCVVACVITNVSDYMGPVMTGPITLMIARFIIRVVAMVVHLPTAFRHYKLVSRCKLVCEQNRQLLSADDICQICQAYCRQVKQKNLHP